VQPGGAHVVGGDVDADHLMSERGQQGDGGGEVVRGVGGEVVRVDFPCGDGV
jgi:hypothetical protein